MFKRYYVFWECGIGGLCYKNFWFKKNAINFSKNHHVRIIAIGDRYTNTYIEE